MEFFRILVACMFGIRTPLFGCIVMVEFAFCLWNSSKVLAELLVSGLEVQSIFIFILVAIRLSC